MSQRPFISLTSDFGVQSQSVGVMEAVARTLSPASTVLHLMHGLPAYSIVPAARTLEATAYLPIGCHVCVCDPGVGSERHALAIEVARGDFLIGPDNGVLLPASRILGGIRYVVSITNPSYMRHPVSPIFHGRDVFVPAAAHLANGVSIKDLGSKLSPQSLAPSCYVESTHSDGVFYAQAIQVNRFGSVHLNVSHADWDGAQLELGAEVVVSSDGNRLFTAKIARTFADVDIGEALVIKDDYGRICLAMNQDSLAERMNISIGKRIEIRMNPRTIRG